MSSNVIPIRFKKKEPGMSRKQLPLPQKKVSLIPSMFQNLLKQYKARQDELKQKKISFLTKEAYRYYYDLLEFPQIADIDLPMFVYEEQRKRIAYQKASKALLDVIKDGRLDECYRQRVKQLKNRK